MNNLIKRVWTRKELVFVEDLRGMAFTNEDGAHTFSIAGKDESGADLALSGTVAGSLIRPDGTTTAMTGTIADGCANVTLSPECYGVSGRASLTIFLTSGGQKTAIYHAVMSIGKSSPSQVSPGVAADVVDLVNRIDTATASIPATYTALLGSIASDYSSSKTYKTGEHVWYGGYLYKANQDIDTAESWTSGHWTKVVLADDFRSEITSLKSEISDIEDGLNFVPQKINLNKSITTNTNSPAILPTNIANENNFCCLCVSCSQGDRFVITGKGGNSTRLWAFADEDGYKIDQSDASKSATDLALVAPEGSAYFAYNSLMSNEHKVYKGVKPTEAFDQFEKADIELIQMDKSIKSEIKAVDQYLEYINPSENLIDFEQLTDGFITGTGNISTPSSTQLEKTSPKIPVVLADTYKFTTQIGSDVGTAWLVVGFWTANDVFKGRYSASVSTVDGVSVGVLEKKPSEDSSLSDVAYMRVSYRSYGERNATALDITMKDETITEKIMSLINGDSNRSYKVFGGRIDVSKIGYDVSQLPFAPLETTGKLTQGMAISNGTIFQGFGNGTVDLYDLDDGTLINSFDIGGDHCGSLSFSDIYPDGNMSYPYMYVASFDQNKTFVYNITDSTFILEKTYQLPTNDAGYCQETCINKVDNTLWCIGHKVNSYSSGQGWIVSQWDLANATNNGDGTYTPNLLKKFEMQWIPYLQFVQCLNGQLFIGTGADSDSQPEYLTRIWVMDLGDCSIKSLMEDFPSAIVSAEPEGIDFVYDTSAKKYYMVLSTRRSVHYYNIVF